MVIAPIENRESDRPITAGSTVVRTAKIWKRIEAVEISLGLKGDGHAHKEILRRVIEQLSPGDLRL